MVIYNTLTKKKEEFQPINPPNVTMYSCGPTVYDYFHIGNARTFIMSDIIRRYLEYKGYKVTYVQNLTDIDDKIIKKSIEEKISTEQVAEKYIKAFFEDIKKMNVKVATKYPKATEHIQEMIEIIKKLEAKGVAYNKDGNVFYDVSKFPEYGKLSGKVIDELESGARVEVNDEKNNPLDFSLWKKAKEGEPSWDSPWGKGRPGWHIECSAMNLKHLGVTTDIHAGGNDLIFPHHENEIAQSEMANEKTFVNYWIHFGFLNIRKEKMSKSLGNFFTAREVFSKYPFGVIRLFFSQSHYRGPLDYDDELLSAAGKGLEKINNLVYELKKQIEKSDDNCYSPNINIDDYKKTFENAMDDDFNTPQAVATIFDFVRDINKELSSNNKISKTFVGDSINFLKNTAQHVLGIIDLEKEDKSEDIELVEDLINILTSIRKKAKAEKLYAFADDIRDRLNEIGVILQDGKNGTEFKIKRKS
ncbi:MAG: cysteine--tRNA ligase [Ignavibacteriales bacterium]|nr:cysteine--tRNA ligase [Ignavibacteriales bacterium]